MLQKGKTRSLIFRVKALALIFSLLFLISCQSEAEKTVFVAILARNKAHTLPRYLQCIEKQTYPKKSMILYFCTNNNEDETKEILLRWIKKKGSLYREVLFEDEDSPLLHGDQSPPHHWSSDKVKVLAAIRQRSMDLTLEKRCDFYFVCDCDNFISPCTLNALVAKNLPIIAPMLTAFPEKGDPYSNFFCDIDQNGYFKGNPNYWPILHRSVIGTFEVPLIHCTYLIRADQIPKLSYFDETNHLEFVVFARSARRKQVKQYICNEQEFGAILHFYDSQICLEEEKTWTQTLFALP